MTYATRQDVEDRFEDDEIADLLPDDSEAADAKMAKAIQDASAEINGVLAVTYRLPLTGAYDQLTAIAADLVRIRLYDEVPTDNVVRRAQSARKRLREIVSGDSLLVAADGTVPARVSSGVAAGGAADPTFTQDTMAGY